MDYNKIRGAAAAYYANSSDKEQLQAWKFYKSLHTDGNGTVSRKEYLSFLEKEGYTDAQIEFRMLDKNGDGSLDFEECTTLFYIIRVHRGAVACKNGCGAYLWPWDIYFVCAECYEAGGDTYDLCCDCYRKKDFKHQHGVFLDKFKLLRDRQPTAEIPTATSTRQDQVQSQTNRETEGIFEAAKAHYAALPESGKQEVRNRFKTMDSDGYGAVSSRSYSDYLTKAGYSDDHLFDLFDKNGDGKLDFDEYITSDFIHTMHGHNRCSGCSVTLLGIYFVCVKCYDAGKTYNLCCKCYGDKSYKHLDDHTHFSDTHSLIDIKRPKPTSATRDQVQSQTNRETEGIFEAAKAHYAALSESGKQEVRNRFKTMDSDGYGAVSSRCYSDYLTKAGYPDDHLFDLFDKNGDGKLDFEEYIASDFIYTLRGRNCCGGCSVALLGIYFVCVKCYDAGKTYNLCCKCYGEKSYKHLDGHTHFSDTHSLIDIKRSKPASATRASMEALVKTARLYYNKSSSKVKDSAHEFYKSLDSNNDRKVSLKEFLSFMRQKGHTKMSNRRFFEELDKDGSGTLEFMEVMALYYIIKSGRPFCVGCDDFIPGMYFNCSKCFENGNPLFCVCPKCFENELYVHEHDQFLDNFALLEAKRMQVIATYSEQHKPTSSVTTTNAVVPHKPQSPKPASSSVTITELPTSTTNVVVYKPQPPKPPSSPVTIVQLLISPTNAVAPPKLKTRVEDSAFRILEGAIAAGVGTLCTIM